MHESSPDRAPLRVRVKFCGVTSPADARSAAELGADAIGLVFHSPSPRNVSATQAAAIVSGLPPFVTRVGLFRDASSSWVHDVIATLRLDVLQFHGHEPAAFCEAFGMPYIKAGAATNTEAVRALDAGHPRAQGLLLDTPSPTGGGSGQTFDWSQIPRDLGRPFILAGGLDPENVGGAIRTCRPYGVDVSSGIERSRGSKDPIKMAAFLREVIHVCSQSA